MSDHTPIIDSHTHAWETWPYQPEVPDPHARGRVEQLLWEMDRCGVDRAVLICARIEHNPENNDYVADCVARHPQRLVQFADVDCCWTETYHQPGAAGRLAAAAERFQLQGFTHYLREEDGWFDSPEGQAFFAEAARLRLIASLALGPEWQPALRRLAGRFPSVPFLCHHMAGARAGEENGERMTEILRSAAVPNIYLKWSGYHYVSRSGWDFPYPDTAGVTGRLFDAFGPERLCWGSDSPVVRANMTYRQSLEAFRSHCPLGSSAERAMILGGNLERLLAEAGG